MVNAAVLVQVKLKNLIKNLSCPINTLFFALMDDIKYARGAAAPPPNTSMINGQNHRYKNTTFQKEFRGFCNP